MSRSDSFDKEIVKHSDQDYTDPFELKFNNKSQESSQRFNSAEIRKPVKEQGYAVQSYSSQIRKHYKE